MISSCGDCREAVEYQTGESGTQDLDDAGKYNHEQIRDGKYHRLMTVQD